MNFENLYRQEGKFDQIKETSNLLEIKLHSDTGKTSIRVNPVFSYHDAAIQHLQ